tara:strand:- start:1501 stop:1647 length:147 start_codon:yes stop_codon:yes gene_type:complete
MPDVDVLYNDLVDGINEKQYEELDSRLQVIEVFIDSVQSIAKSKKQLS